MNDNLSYPHEEGSWAGEYVVVRQDSHEISHLEQSENPSGTPTYKFVQKINPTVRETQIFERVQVSYDENITIETADYIPAESPCQ